MENIKLCDYGCGREAKYHLKNDKWCCCESCNKCIAQREKNSNGLKKSHASGKGYKFSDKDRAVSQDTFSMKTFQDFLSNPIKHYSSKTLVTNLLYSGREYKCEKCGITEWQGSKITLEVDHIDGNHGNNHLDNLRFLCPNCHSQTETYCGRNSNTGKNKVSDEEMAEALRNSPSIRQALIKLGLAPQGGNYSRAFRLINKENIKI